MDSAAREPSDAATCPLPRPLDGLTWAAVIAELALPPQQERVVRLVMLSKQDKEIAHELGIALPTVRTYLNRVYASAGVTDRMQLVHRVYAVAIQAWAEQIGPRP